MNDLKDQYKHIFFSRSTIDFYFNKQLISQSQNSLLILIRPIRVDVSPDLVLINSRFENFFFKFSKFPKIRKLVFFYFRKKLINFLAKIELSEKPDVFFDHNNDILIKTLNKAMKDVFNARTFALPHANLHIENRMVDINMYQHPKKIKLTEFDRVITTSKSQGQIIEGNAFLVEDLSLLNLNRFRNKKPKCIDVAFLHSKFIGNIHIDEFFRTIELLRLHIPKNDLKVKLHPRTAWRERRRVIKSVGNDLIYNGSLDELLLEAKFVMHCQTSCTLEALTAGCRVILLDFLSSNKVVDEIKQFCHVLETPDDLCWALENNLDFSNFSPKKTFKTAKKIDANAILRRITE